MLKFLLALLLLANGTLYAYNAGYLGAAGSDGHEPGRAARQINAPQMRLLPVRPAAPAPAPVTGTAPVSGAANAPAVVGIDLTATAAATAAAPEVAVGTVPLLAVATPAGVTSSFEATGRCVEIGNFDAAEARRFDALLIPLALGPRLSRRSVAEVDRYIVYIPPLADKDSAERKAVELRRLGVTDFFIFSDSSDLRWGISLGLFKSAEAARVHLADLTQRGVRSARVAPRMAAGGRAAYQLRDLDANAEAALARIRSGFPKQETRTCKPA